MIKILIVDDEKPICDLVDLNLSAAGYFCKSVQDGMKAIELIEKETFDLILLDIMLPGVDGFDIMEYIRPLKIPVIFITAKGDVKGRSGTAQIPQTWSAAVRRRCSGGYGSQNGDESGRTCGTYQQGIRTSGVIYSE